MGSGVAGPSGLRALEDIKPDKGSVTIHCLKTEAAPAQAQLRKRSAVREGALPAGGPAVAFLLCALWSSGRRCSPPPAPTWGLPEGGGRATQAFQNKADL